MAFKDLEEFFDPTLKLPVRGKTYVIQPVDAETGLWVEMIMGVAAKVMEGGDVTDEDKASIQLDDEQERDLMKRVLGDTHDELIADGLDWTTIKLVGNTVLIWVSAGEEPAEEFWNAGGVRPKAGRKVPQDRKPKASRSAKKTTTASPAGTTG